ncbi:MAG: glycine cleavage system protein GcvH [Alphaproteobacteria bacterium]|nr:glycine cleavage system protein H [Alphaproteobacteria bacterium]MCS5596033.1 glycine cleavage system protein GcvH [Alphaproteobacteria bacterium]|tara:strand:- start:1538 stop:1912 length:375 start_codon:yes stop_codon:yes gene_type:complete
MSETKYTKDHEEIKIDGDIVWIGITKHAGEALGDLVFVELPDVGATFDKGADFAVIESVKAAAEVYTPVGGEIVEVNDALPDNPEQVKEDMDSGWIVKIRMNGADDLSDLMDEAAYQAFCAENA